MSSNIIFYTFVYYSSENKSKTYLKKTNKTPFYRSGGRVRKTFAYRLRAKKSTDSSLRDWFVQ